MDKKSFDQNKKNHKSFGKFKKKSSRDFRKSNSPFRKSNNRFPDKTKHYSSKEDSTPADTSIAKTEQSELIRLNKYLSNAGICSRREADKYIEAGAVKVNGKIITQLGYKVSPGDKVQFGDNKVHKDKLVYIVLNKPKGYITTCDDPHERGTVMDLIEGVQERIYPVGRLDRNTTGILLLTNDGELAKKLMHPKYQVPKVYHVVLDKSLKPDDLDKMRQGIELEDGSIKPDEIAYVNGADTKKEVGVEIHSGRNRIVRRMFESMGYNVVKLDRVLYATLTKKNVARGKWRFLTDGEARMLKQFR